MQDTIIALVEEFWKGLGITLEKIEVVVVSDDINIDLQTPDSALIIGMHGKSLESFCHVLARMIEKKTGMFVHVHLEVNDYMKEKDERMFRFLESKIAEVISTGKTVHIENLSSYDRKKAHNYIAEKNIKGLTTQSEGAAHERILTLNYIGEIHPKILVPQVTGVSHTIESLSEDGVGI